MKTLSLNSLTIHDISLSDTLGYKINNPIDGLDFPSIRLAEYDKPGEHGAHVSNQLYGARMVNITGKVWAGDIATFNSLRRTLQAAVRITQDSNGFKQPFLVQLETDDGLLLQCLAFLQSIKMSDEQLTNANFMITLFVPDPNLYFQTATTGYIDLGTTPVYATNNGDAQTYPVFTFAGPLHHPQINNDTLTIPFKLNYDLGGGDVIVVDMAKKTIVLNGITNEMAAFDIGNEWIWLDPGTNQLSLTTTDGTDTGNVTWLFNDAYIGY